MAWRGVAGEEREEKGERAKQSEGGGVCEGEVIGLTVQKQV